MSDYDAAEDREMALDLHDRLIDENEALRSEVELLRTGMDGARGNTDRMRRNLIAERDQARADLAAARERIAAEVLAPIEALVDAWDYAAAVIRAEIETAQGASDSELMESVINDLRKALALSTAKDGPTPPVAALVEQAKEVAQRAVHTQQDRMDRTKRLMIILGESDPSEERLAEFVKWADYHTEWAVDTAIEAALSTAKEATK